MARNIAGTYTTGLNLTNAGDNPIAIASGASIANAAGIGLESSLPVYLSITNATNGNITGNSFGVSLANAGIFANSGHITASNTSGSGFSYDNTTQSFRVLSAALFLGGGAVSNGASGVISGGFNGVGLGQAGTVVNAGNITGTATNAGFGVALAAGGAVTNASGGLVSGTRYGIFSDGAVSITNQAAATITGASRGIYAINGTATVNNQGVLSGGYHAIWLRGGTVTNQGTVSGGFRGVYILGGPGSVSNQGTILNTIQPTTQTLALGGVLLVAGGSISNGSTGLISSTSYGALVYGSAGTITNAGTIASSRSAGGVAVAVVTGGTISNAANAVISSAFYGAMVKGGTGTVTNAGTISSTRTSAGAAVILQTGGSATNSAGGVITGEWIGFQSGIFNSPSPSAASPITVDNSGTISAADGKGDGAAVWVHGPGVVINRGSGVIQGAAANGTIVGGPLNGLLNGGFGIVAYYQTTVINYGSIGGAAYAFDAAGTSPTIGNLIEMAPGATFGGIVLGAHSAAQANLSTLELMSGASVGTVTGFGTQYRNFGNIAIDNGARWNLGGTVSVGTTIAFAPGGIGSLTLTTPASMQGTISGFAAGDTLSLAGITATGSSFSNGVLTLNEASGAISINLPGIATTPDFTVTNGAGGATVTVVGPNLLNGLSINQQLELIYIAYFNRAADGGGFTFWAGQNAQAQNNGQSAAVALTNIANSFTPQTETIALYPFLGTPNINLNSPEGQAGLTTFINSLYGNLFGHAPDAAGQSYWVGQLTSGAVGLGAAALAIANGATGADAIEVFNKITVALDFTVRTSAADLGKAIPLPNSFLTAARGVLSGVDAISLTDASVTAGMNATTAFINGSTTSHATSLAISPDPSTITITTPNSVIDPGTGDHTIQFLAGAGGDTLVLHAGGVDQISGFDPTTDVLDIRSLLSEANIDLNDNIAALGNYVTIADQGADALIRFSPDGQAGATTVAVLRGSGNVITSLETAIAQGAIRAT